MTDLENAQCIYSDLYKDVNGFRPRHVSEENWNDLDWLLARMDSLQDELEHQLVEEEKLHRANVVEFENKIQELIDCGAGDRATAIRWLMEGGEVTYGSDELEYQFNIPFGYINERRDREKQN